MVQPQVLGRLRFPVQRSRGRRYPELPHPYRNDFQRDRDRVVHARAFRRLEDKTQVFTPNLSDHFRNRLTHTIEVSQIARTVAAVLGLEEDLTEALALAHDIGHPPFGHAGEHELNLQMERFGDRFDHNLHALRVVEIFEQRYALFSGLNLTFEVREGIVKHSADLTPGRDPSLEEYLPALRPPLEAQLIDLADEIAYNTADLDDAHSALLITSEELVAAVPAFAEVYDAVQSQFPGAPERIQFLECVRRLIDILVSSLIEGTAANALAAGVQDVEDVRRHPHRLAGLAAAGEAVNASLKRFLHARVYSTEDLRAERLRSTTAIAQLFQFFLDHPDRLPPTHQVKATRDTLHRTVCDYIAGMTDGFFWRTWNTIPSSPIRSG
ncbi:MAG: Deoxyguanosinetriphosphate triphosphohydrolase-like protein [Bryobacteraceae bacterium]|nr:Deoxyguanosinetriphosphate triphosphohydrolase-like protein [Bryobacteraceae bacterium]